MQVTQYRYRNAVNAFYEMPTTIARRLLPDHLEPMELRHGSGIFALTAFDFTDSMVGPYQEIVLAVIVPPLVKAGGAFPKSAFYPFLLGTSTRESRQHAIERWHLPHYMRDVQVALTETGEAMHVKVCDAGAPVLDFSVTAHEWKPVHHLYQCFMRDDDQRFKVDIHMEGTLTEHEEERGTIALYDHPMCQGLMPNEIASYPFRELWMKDGVQTFDELETI
jgi:hypothetical protein